MKENFLFIFILFTGKLIYLNTLDVAHNHLESLPNGKFICEALRDLLPFVQFKKCEKHPWRRDTLSKVALLKVTLLHRCFAHF